MKPNFLIIGAARAGTTALYHCVRQHPEIFVSRPKELRFFAKADAPAFGGPGDENVNRNWVTTWEEYCRHFADVNGQKAIGEASPFYLCSEEAPKRIRRFLPDAKLVVVLRDPVSRAFSSFMYLRRAGREPLSDFRSALQAEDVRRQDNWEYLWQYRSLGLYSTQLERYLDVFPRELIWIGLFDDLGAEPIRFCQMVYAFLEVDPDFRPRIAEGVNASGEPRSRTLQDIVDKQNPLRSFARSLLPKSFGRAIRRTVLKRNLRRDVIPRDVEQELRAYYRPEIERLEILIGRDLSAWR
jgi:hypothetical protein